MKSQLLIFFIILAISAVVAQVVTTGASGALTSFSGTCPECQKEGKKSTVSVGMSIGTLMAAHSYYDENGRYIYNDPNTYTTGYSCSNGHSFSVSRKSDPMAVASMPEVEWMTSGIVAAEKAIEFGLHENGSVVWRKRQ